MQSKHINPSTLIQAMVVTTVFLVALSPLAGRTAFDTDEQITMQRMQRVVMATLNYTADNGGVLPLSMSFSTVANRWRVSTYSAVPAGWTQTGHRDIPPISIEEQSFVLNSIRPYLATLADLGAKGMPLHSVGFVPARAQNLPGMLPVGVSFNGLLHSWQVDSVASPGRLPLFTQHYRENEIGANISIPVLCCTNVGPTCRFNPTGYPQSGQTSCAFYGSGYGYVWFQSASSRNFSVWAYGHNLVFGRVDGSVESRTLEAPHWPNYALNVNVNPWSSFEPAQINTPGGPYWQTDCVQPGGVKPTPIFYMGYYRPDNEFNYEIKQCDFGGG